MTGPKKPHVCARRVLPNPETFADAGPLVSTSAMLLMDSPSIAVPHFNRPEADFVERGHGRGHVRSLHRSSPAMVYAVT
jgi:hypothetical protein